MPACDGVIGLLTSGKYSEHGVAAALIGKRMLLVNGIGQTR
jgi:hypothetical protein